MVIFCHCVQKIKFYAVFCPLKTENKTSHQKINIAGKGFNCNCLFLREDRFLLSEATRIIVNYDDRALKPFVLTQGTNFGNNFYKSM